MDLEYLKKEIREIFKEENQAFIKSILDSKKELSQPLEPRTYLTSKELCNQYSISDRTLINWQHKGLKPMRIGRKKYFEIKTIERFLNSQTNEF